MQSQMQSHTQPGMQSAVIEGVWFTGATTARIHARLAVDAAGGVKVLAADDQRVLATGDFAGLKISSRLGNTPRYLHLADGGQFETRANDAIDALVAQWQPGGFSHLIHLLETHLQFVIVTAVVVMALVWGTVFYGLPRGAEKLAHALPADTLDTLASETLTVLDKTHFDPSTLSPERQRDLLAAFAPVLADYASLNLTVLFRTGGEKIGANAFALPDGTIIFTDEMVALSETDDELIAVLAHEIGHVERRHSLRAVLQNAALGMVYVTLVGDASAVGDLILGLPVLAATLAYSRDHETEADDFSGAYLDSIGVERQAFVDIMQRLGKTHQCRALIEDADDIDPQSLTDAERLKLCEKLIAENPLDQAGAWQVYFSTHPGLEERLEHFVR